MEVEAASPSAETFISGPFALEYRNTNIRYLYTKVNHIPRDSSHFWGPHNMEVVGSVASIATLLELAFKSYSFAARLVKDLHDAPRALSRVTEQLNILKCELSLLLDIQKQTAEGDDILLLPSEASILERALSSAHRLLCSFHKDLGNQKPLTGNRSRLVWIFKDKSRVESLLRDLQQTESSLNTVLLLVNVRLSAYSWKLNSSTRSKPAFSLPNGNKATPGEDSSFKLPRSATGLTPLLNRNPQAWNVLFGSWRSSDYPWLIWLGSHFILTCYGNSLHTSYFVSGKIGPWRLFGRRAICFDLGLRVFPMATLGLSVLGATLSLRNVVSETSEIMLACRNGDTRMVRQLFSCRRASPYDVTPENSNVMRYAIESGSLELVQFLLYNGADVNATFGKYNTSPLQWAFASRHIEIARFLLSCGARLDYLCSRGWTPIMHLFWPSRPPIQGGFLELLCGHSFSDFDVQDEWGATALHRASALGTADDVRLLLQAGASPLIQDNERGWMPVFDAISKRKSESLRILAQHMFPGLPNIVDFRGWTLLPIAIESEDLEIMRAVLELGVDPHRLVKMKAENSAKIHEVTPVALSRAKGPEVHQTFLTALQLAGFDVSLANNCDDDVDDSCENSLFWPAESGGDAEKPN